MEYINYTYSKVKYEKLAKIKNLEHVTNIFNQRRKMIKPMKQLFKITKMWQKNDLNLNLRPQNISKISL